MTLRKRAKLDKRKYKKATSLTEAQKLEFAQKLVDGKMIKQAVADYNISISQGYMIAKELVEWKVDWKLKADKDFADA